MAETEAVSTEVPRAVGDEPKCGPETGFSPPKPVCNGNNHHGNDIDNSYVFVSGADAADTKVSTAGSGEISDPHIVKVNGYVESINGDTLEGLTGKTESSAEVEVEQVEEGSEAAVDGEQENSGLASGLEVSPGSKIGVSGLVAGSGESGGSINISSHIDSSGYANGECGDQVETMEACQGSQDVVVGVVDCESQDVSVGSAEDGVKFAGEDRAVDVVDVSVKAEGEVNLSAEVVENGECENFQPSSLDLESKSINTKEETNVVAEVVQGESADVSGNVEDEVKLLEEVIKTGELDAPPSTSLNVDLELDPINSKTETEVVEGVVESRDVGVNAEDKVKLLEQVIKTGELEASPSTSSDVDLESDPINSKEETNMVEGVVECELQGVSVNANDEVKLPAEHGVPKAISLDLDMELDPIHTKEETHVLDDVVDCELQDASVKIEDETRLSGEVVEVAELKIPSSTSFGVVLEPSPINSKEEIYVIEDVVDCGSQYVSANADDEVMSSVEVLETTEHEDPQSISLDLELDSNPTNTKVETDVVENVVEFELQDVIAEASGEVKLPREVVETSEHEIPPSTSLDVDLESESINIKEENDLAEDVVETELHNACMKVHRDDGVKLSREVVDTAAQEIPPSASLDVDLESISKNSQEEKDVVEDELQDVCVKVHAEDKVKLSGEVVETAELEIPSSTSLNLDLESNPINREDGIYVVEDVVEHDIQNASVKAEDEIKLSEEAVETAEHEIPPSAPLDLDLLTKNPINTKEEIDVAEDVAVCELKDESLKVEDEKSSEEAVETAEHEVPTSTSSDFEMELHPINTKEETDVVLEVVQCESQDLSVKAKDEVKLLEEVTETAEHEVSLSKSLDLDSESKSINTEEKINVAANVERESQDANLKTNDEVKVFGEVVEIAEHEVPSSTSLDSNLESNPTNTKVEIVANAVECDLQDANVQTEDNVKLSSEVVEIAEHEVPSSTSDVNKKGAANSELEAKDVEVMVNKIDGAPGNSDENLPLGEIVDTGNSKDNITPVAPPSSSSENMTDREEASLKTKRKPFNFLIRVPRFDDECLREQIRLAKLNIDEKTKLRDAIQAQIQEKRASTQVHGIDYEYAKGESRNARKSVRSKRMEIESLQSVINKAKNALSVDDIDSQIYNMERMIQHETLQLKEEKQLIREIKQLKQLREQLSSNMGSQDEIKQALEQRGEAEERLKILRKELDVLKGKVLKAEAAAVEAEKKYDDENKKVRELQAQFRASDEVRQAAYAQWQSVRTELSKKSEYFFKYKDDAAIASNYVYSRDTDALYRVCMNNVERFMALWNTNGEFRRDYAKFNARSTVWRLGTLDGRALGPDESPPVLPSYADSRASRIVPTPVKVDLVSQFPTLELKQDRSTESVASNSKSTKKVTEEKNQTVTNKGPAISTHVNGLDTVSGEDIIHEEPKKSREEIEAIKKAEEMERKEAESKLKEQRRLEALAKASEARERKKKQAEKLQMRAELKTLKEAEQKEKEREKRLRKKERKRAAATDVSDTNTCEIGPASESAVETTSKEAEAKEVSSSVVSKKPKKHWLFGKQGKTKSSIPPPLRNRNKKKLQQWMWVGFTSLAILFVFWMGNVGIFSSSSYKRRSPVMT